MAGVICFEANPVWVPGGETVELRVLVDDIDILSQLQRDYIGLYPPDFFAQRALLDKGRLSIGLCQCGCDGCGGVEVDVDLQGSEIVWSTMHTGLLKQWRFDVKELQRALTVARRDLSWERTEDTIKRLLKVEDYSAALKHGLKFKGGALIHDASGVILTFEDKGGTQRTMEIACPTYEPGLAIAAVRAYLDRQFTD